MNQKRKFITVLKIHIAGVAILLGGNAYAQPDTSWTKIYGGTNSDEGRSVVQTADGGYIIAGWTASFGAGLADIWLIKTDALGDSLWTKTYGGADFDWGFSVAQTADGGYIVTGWTASFGAGENDVYLIKTNALGDTQWTRTYGGVDSDWGFSVVQTADSGYVIAGSTESFGAGLADVWLIKIDALGDSLWTKTYGGIGDDVGFSVVQSPDRGYIVAGLTASFGAGGDNVYLIKTNALGDT